MDHVIFSLMSRFGITAATSEEPFLEFGETLIRSYLEESQEQVFETWLVGLRTEAKEREKAASYVAAPPGNRLRTERTRQLEPVNDKPGGRSISWSTDVAAGLSYYRGWIDEWGTGFFEFARTAAQMLPGMEFESVPAGCGWQLSRNAHVS
jgi:hypothetical protein